MKISPYRLQPVLDIREKKEEEAKIALASSQTKLQQEMEKEKLLKEEQQTIQQAQQKVYQQMSNKLSQGSMKIQELQLYQNYKKGLINEELKVVEKITQQQQEIKKAQLNVNSARQKLIDACKERQIIEKHKENWLQKVKKEQEQKEQKEQDELGNVLYSFRGGRK